MFSASNVTVMVSDMDRAVRFYRDTLGLKFVRGYGAEWVEIDAPGLRIGLHPGGKRAQARGNLSIGLRVDDLDNAKRILEAKGVLFSASKEDGGVRLADFTDPDGNALYLVQVLWG
jgi:catechol 2,3-dioxygenase-like lactoylglutathione lyase family enzyme